MSGSHLGQITSGKQVGAQNRKRPNKGHVSNFQNHEITGKDSYVQSNWSWKKNKIDLQISLRAEIQTIISSYLSSGYHADSLWTENINLHLRKIFGR